jgi:hypothetical protein
MERQFFVKLDENNIVIDIAVVTQEFLEANPQRYEGRWVETFFEHENKTYAGIGFVYDEGEKDFYDPAPLPPPIPE